jgi:hypothetical protein
MKAAEFTDRRPSDWIAEDDTPAEESGFGWVEDSDQMIYADSSMTLPGKGDRGKNCGQWYPQEFCNECGEPRFGESRCLERNCPECWRAWSKQRTVGIIERLQKAREAANSGLQKRVVHAVASPPQDSIQSLNDIDRGFRTAYEKAEAAGIHGGTAIFHGYRVTDDAKSRWGQDTCRGSDGSKLWQWVREHDEHWRELTYWSPHWHIIGIAPEVESSDSDEWIIERIRTLERYQMTSMDSYRDIAKAAMYVISHTTFEKDASKDSIRWYGSLSTAKFRAEKEISDGAISTIERKAAEAVEKPIEDDSGDDTDNEAKCVECGSANFSSIFEAGGALIDQGWCDRIGPEQEHRLNIAFQWAINEIEPPPGLKNPGSEADAREAFKELL